MAVVDVVFIYSNYILKMEEFKELIEFVISIYVYCTDFVINLANILNLSYYEINAWIFCILWPIITILLVLIRTTQIIYKLYSR